MQKKVLQILTSKPTIFAIGVYTSLLFVTFISKETKLAELIVLMHGAFIPIFIFMPISYQTAQMVCETKEVCTTWDIANGCTNTALEPAIQCTSFIEGSFGILILLGYFALYIITANLIQKIITSIKTKR